MIKNSKIRRKLRISGRYHGTSSVPRLVVYRSNKVIYAQAIDDDKRVTLAAYGSLQLQKDEGYKKLNKTDEARLVGKKLSEIAKNKNIDKIVFDRGCYAYLGRVKALAESLRESGLKF